MFDCMRSVNGPGQYVYIAYFLLLMVVGLYIMLNLFLAILLDGFSLSEGDEDETKSSSLVSLGKMILVSFGFSWLEYMAFVLRSLGNKVYKDV